MSRNLFTDTGYKSTGKIVKFYFYANGKLNWDNGIAFTYKGGSTRYVFYAGVYRRLYKTSIHGHSILTVRT